MLAICKIYDELPENSEISCQSFVKSRTNPECIPKRIWQQANNVCAVNLALHRINFLYLFFKILSEIGFNHKIVCIFTAVKHQFKL